MTQRMSYSALKRRRSFHAAGDRLESRLTLSGLTLFVTSPADGGAGTLRAAIVAANANPGSTIDFRLQLVPNTINLLGPLPLITAPVKIDGTSQPGYKGTPLITVTGVAAAAPASSGFDFEHGSSGSAIQGLEITGFNTAAITVNNTANITIGGATSGQGNVISGNPGDGISLKNAGTSGVTVEGNDIGTDPSGTVAMANGIGVSIAGAMANTIGGLVAVARNVISGNTTDGIQITSSPPGPAIGPAASLNVVEGNYIGTNAAGNGVLANGGDGVNINGGATSNTIGGDVAAAQNVISGNTTAGVAIAGLGTSRETVAGNLIGTDASGQTALANGIGVSIVGTTGNTIGGLVSAARNVISGNAADGVVISGGGKGPAASLIVVEGNYIGTNAAGNGVLANGGDGININGGATSNTIGGSVAAARNVISGNTTAGVAISGLATSGETSRGQPHRHRCIGSDRTGQWNRRVHRGDDRQHDRRHSSAPPAMSSLATRPPESPFPAQGRPETSVAGNFIGTDVSGQTALGNGIGVLVSGGISTSIGGTTAGAGNVISGNFTAGIELDGNAVSGIQIVGNRIGTDPTGSFAVVRSGQSDPLQALQNAGIAVIGSQGNTIGGNTPATGNLISGNYVGVMLATISGARDSEPGAG